MSFRGSRATLLAVFLMTTLLACASEPVAPPASPTEPEPHVATLPSRSAPPAARVDPEKTALDPAPFRREHHCELPPSPALDAGAPDASRVDGGLKPISNAEKVIASLRPKFRVCYNRGLAADPTMDGCVTLRAHVAPEGSVSSTDTMVNDGLSPDVVGCLDALLRGAVFDPPGARGSTLLVPIKFVQRRAPPQPLPPPHLVPAGPSPTAPMVDGVAGFRFGMTVAEFAQHCREVGRPNPLLGNDPKLRTHTCDAVEVEPGMRLNMFLGFCEGDSRLCEINDWTNRNALLAYRILESKLVARYGNAPVQNGDLRDETLEQQCAAGGGKLRLTWWWGAESAPTGRALLALDCKGSDQYVGVYYDDPSGTAEQVERAKREGAWPAR